MADIDKVTKGLECHKNGLCQIDDKTSCPYWECEKDCSKHLMGDALELLKSQQAEIELLKAEKNRVIEQIESEIHRVLRECGGVKDDVGKAQYQWLINGYQSALDMIKDGEQE